MAIIIKINKGEDVKRYIYTIQINVNKFYALEYNPESKSSDPILLPLMHENEDQGAFLYRSFEKQEEAQVFFKMLSYFCTASEIEVSVEKAIMDENDTLIGAKEIANFTLKDEEYPEEKIKDFYKNIDWNINIEVDRIEK